MNLPEFGVRRPVTNFMIFCSVIILAFYSFTSIGIDLFPQIEPPVINVISVYPGAGPEDVETKVTENLENQLGTTPGLEKITSYSSEGTSVISLKFIWGTNLDQASNDVRDRIELAKRFLPDIPDEMDNPFIFKFNTANIPILFVGFTAKESFPELYDLVDKRLADELKQLPGVGTVQFHGGGLERQINIWVDREKLEGYGFSILDIENVLRRENITQPVGSLKSGLTDYLIRLPGEWTSPDQISEIILAVRNGKVVYLKDVARVEDSFKEVTTIARINKQQGLMMMVQKQSGTNTVEVSQRVKKRLQTLQKRLPTDVKTHVIFDSSGDIAASLATLKSTVWFSIFLVILVVWFFLRQFAASMVIALTIPFSLLISFIYLFLSGKTINVISLSSIAITAGMVVDNAIVVVDNISRGLERGQLPVEAAISRTSEMFLAIAASTFTTIVVFMPLLFLKGVAGKMFGELAAIVIATLIASLWTAVTFTPMLCSKWFKLREQQKNRLQKLHKISESWFKNLEELYARALTWCLNHRGIVIIGFLSVFMLSLFLIPFVGSEFIPEEDTGDVRITVHLPVGTRLEQTDNIACEIEEFLETDVPEAKYYYSRSGEVTGMAKTMGQASGSYIIAAGAKLVPKTQRQRSDKEVAQALRDKIRAIPGVIKADISTGNPIGRLITGGGGKAIQVDIIGHSFEQTMVLAEKVKSVLKDIPGAVDVSISREMDRPELRIEVDREKAGALGLDMDTIARSIKTFIQGSTATKYREKGETYDIYLRLDESARSKPEDLENLTFILPLRDKIASFSPLAKSIKLSNIARIYQAAGPQEIERQNRERVVRVSCNAYKRSTGKIIEDLNKELKKISIPNGIMVNIAGEAEEQAKAFKDLALLLILSIFLVYLVMASQFESYLDPFIIMFSIPFTFIGVILGFVLTRTSLSVVTFLGIVMLMGIVVNNAIVLISYINILRTREFSLKDAITQGGRDRLRPVLMTTVTTLVGLLPLALSRGQGSESWQPLGITMLSGLSVSTFITMLFVPTLYAVFEEKIS